MTGCADRIVVALGRVLNEFADGQRNAGGYHLGPERRSHQAGVDGFAGSHAGPFGGIAIAEQFKVSNERVAPWGGGAVGGTIGLVVCFAPLVNGT